MWTDYVPMKTATVRELRNEFAKLEAWLGEGEEIRIEKRGEAIAILRPIGAEFKLDADLQLCVSMRILWPNGWPNWGTKGASRGL